MNEFQQAILRTLIFFDIFDYPLTLMEVWKWLCTDKTLIHTDGSRMAHGWLTDIMAEIDQMKNKVQSKNGFYFLKGREEIIKTRLSRYNISEDKFKRAIKFIKILRFIPFIRCLIVCNRLGYSNVHPDSDIDIAIIAKKDRLWLTRLLAVGFLTILKVRPRQIERAKAIDLSFFINEENLNLESLKYEEDIVFPYWVSQFIPVYDDGVFKKFVEENQWVKKFLPNCFAYQLNQRRVVSSSLLIKIVRWLISLLTDWNFLEKWSKKYQLKIMPPVLKEMMNQDSRVVVNDQLLKFHQTDRRREYQKKFDRLFDYLTN